MSDYILYCVAEMKKVETTVSLGCRAKDGLKKAKKKVEDDVKSSPKFQEYKSPVSYSQAIQPKKLEEPICKSLNDTNDICVNVPLVDVLAGMPNYGKFLKDLITRKGEHEQASTAFLKTECDAITKKRDMPSKLGDPGPFIIPYEVDGLDMMRSLSDSGASINLMHCTLYSQLNLGDLKPTTTGVTLIDRSVIRLAGIVDILVVKVEKGKVIALILGRPFLATASALIEVKVGK
ncbi:uncharacterized protein [Rutidosis leptorrhynchoides]|uniref:uncharacterized protein n=1 Tax=Rutidosis leptorrhynchoides TaxID=125765 RepID=UPI003A993977